MPMGIVISSAPVRRLPPTNPDPSFHLPARPWPSVGSVIVASGFPDRACVGLPPRPSCVPMCAVKPDGHRQSSDRKDTLTTR